MVVRMGLKRCSWRCGVDSLSACWQCLRCEDIEFYGFDGEDGEGKGPYGPEGCRPRCVEVVKSSIARSDMDFVPKEALCPW